VKVSQDRIGFDISTGERVRPERREATGDQPFRIALLGDFTGHPSKGLLSARRPVLVDRDNFETVLARSDLELELAAGALPINELDDFHPDRIYEKMALFRSLRELRKRLSNPETFASAARDLLGDAPSPVPAPSAPAAAGADLLDAILGGESGGGGAVAARPARSTDELQSFIRKVVEPHLVPGEDPRAPELIRQVDEAAARHMRAILHDPAFQAAEARWRAVDLLARRIETGPDLKLFLIDIGRAELDNPRDLFKLLVENSGPWSLLVADYTFGSGDVEMLASLAGIAREAGAPFVGGADSKLVGCRSLGETPDPDDWSTAPDERWQALRQTSAASYLGMVMPRFLARIPYGEDADSCELFRFEEMPGGRPEAGAFCWANSAFLCALLLGESFAEEGWQMRAGAMRDVDHLPLYVYQDDGEAVSHAVTEAYLTERSAERIIEHGIMPLAAMKDSERARLVRFQSIADPPAALSGRWQ
jgi:type VI secretion system protein ImpC